MYVTEYVLHKHPSIPAEVTKTIVDAFCGPESLAKIGSQLGVQFVLRWKNENENVQGPPAVRSWVVNSLIGAYFMEKGPMDTKKWIKQYVLSREVDVKQHLDLDLKLKRPRQLLSHIIRSMNKPAPVAR
jgi:dsRNA-specific ribonuclease